MALLAFIGSFIQPVAAAADQPNVVIIYFDGGASCVAIYVMQRSEICADVL